MKNGGGTRNIQVLKILTFLGEEDLFCRVKNSAFVTFRGLALYREKLSECTRKNDEFNSLAKMTNSINCTKFRNN